MSLDDDLKLVIDAGSRFTKAGFAGDHFPRASFPTAVGRFRHQGCIDGFPDMFFGQEAIANRGTCNLTWPVEEGLIKNWDEMERIWFSIFYKSLLVPSEKCRVLHSVHPLVPQRDRERMAEIFFESFAVSGLNLVKSPILTLHASGRTTGLVYENGACSSFVTPVFEGYPLLHTMTTCDLTGEALTRRLAAMIAELGYSFTTSAEMALIDEMKIKLCYIARNYKEECENSAASDQTTVRFDLPDGQHVLLSDERFKCTEVLFQPSLAGLACPSVAEYIMQSIQKCDIDIRHKMYENIVISGGSTQFPGFGTRLVYELTSLMKAKKLDFSKKVKLDELPTRQTVTWVGGSMLASLDHMKGFWMTKDEYDDIGPDRVNYKFY
ncbi:actin domain-containing protein [Phthorimaea operculella]|nr:actin domain-containing protein [Phthorimaea operculella]